MRGDTAQVRLGSLAKLKTDTIDLAVLKSAQIIPREASKAKVFLSGTLSRAVTLKGIAATKGAADAIRKSGGKVETASPAGA
jgi:large subunit ribosomal protein L15